MKLITVAGPPSSDKTSVILKLIEGMNQAQGSIGVVKPSEQQGTLSSPGSFPV